MDAFLSCAIINLIKTEKGDIVSNKDIQRFQEIRSHIDKLELSEEEKSNSYKHIEEWYAQDKAFGALYSELASISPKIEALFEEMGLI